MSRSDTLTRVFTAAILVPVVLAVVLWAPQPVYVAMIALVALLALREYLDLADRSGQAPLRYFCYIAVAVLVVWPLAEGAVGLLVMLALALVMRPSRSLEKVLPGASASLLGILYIGLPLAMLANLRRLPYGPQWVVYVLGLTWVSDTAAYFVGRAFGRRKLSPRISPAKTWEGAVASVVAAVAFGMVYLAYVIPGVSPGWSAGTAVVVNVAGQVGDLAESALKRSAGVKDSSGILPGHGGFLDRVDALLFAVPALWYIFFLYPRSV